MLFLIVYCFGTKKALKVHDVLDVFWFCERIDEEGQPAEHSLEKPKKSRKSFTFQALLVPNHKTSRKSFTFQAFLVQKY